MPPLFLISENSKNSFLGVDIFSSLWYIQFAIENNTAKTSPHEMRTSLSFLLSWQIQNIIVVTEMSIIILRCGLKNSPMLGGDQPTLNIIICAMQQKVFERKKQTMPKIRRVEYKEAPPVDWLWAAILERQKVLKIDLKTLAGVGGCSYDMMRKYINRSPWAWPQDVRRNVCDALGIQTQVSITMSDSRPPGSVFQDTVKTKGGVIR